MDPRKLIELWVEAFNQADAELLASFYHDQAINHQVAEAAIEGKDEIRRKFIEEFENAKMVCIVENIFQEGEWGILEWKDPLGLRGCGFFRILNGKILFQRGYWDKLTFLRQCGLPINENI